MTSAIINTDQTRPHPPDTVVVGVIADTHIPDRVRDLHPALLPRLQAEGVSQILHAGDISIRRVLDQLAEVAPVTAVRGNRDFLAGPLNLVEELELGGIRVVLMHGHGGIKRYLVDKVHFIRSGYKLERYLPLLRRAGEAARVVIFGHTHFPVNREEGELLLLNPGSASFGAHLGGCPTFGLLRISPDGTVEAKIHKLEGYEIKHRRWVTKTAGRR